MKKTRKLWEFAIGLSATCAICASAEGLRASADGLAPNATAVGLWTNDPIKLDGKLDEPAWRRAPLASGFREVGTGGKVAQPSTSFRVLTDGKSLYVGVRSEDTSGPQAIVRDHDGPVFTDDSVELFLDPSGRRELLVHLIVNAAGSTFDSSSTINTHINVAGDKEPEKWNVDWSAPVAVEARAWTVEFGIPLETLGVVGNFPVSMGLNVCRNRPRKEAGASSWAPVHSRFAETRKMGALFLASSSGEYCTLDLAADSRFVTGSPMPQLRSTFVGTKSTAIRCECEMIGEAGLVVRGESPVAECVPGKSRNWAAIPEVPESGLYRLTAQLRDTASSRVLAAVTRYVDVRLPLELETTPGSCYSQKVEGHVTVFRETGANQDVELAFVQADGATSKVVDKLRMPAGKNVPFRFDAARRTTGTYAVRGELHSRGAGDFVTETVPFRYAQIPEFGFSETGFLTGPNGPIFPIGMYTLQGGEGQNDRVLAEAREAGFNTTVFYAYTTETITPLLDAAARHDIRAFVYVSNPFRIRENKITREELLRDLEARVNHPALLGWYLVDEPEGIGEADERTVRRLYDNVKSADADHPCSLVIMSPEAATQYGACADVIWIDPYPVPDRPVSYVAECIAGARKAVGDRKPVWGVLQAFDWNVWRKGRIDGVHRPTPEEERCMTYLALVHGAKGIIYWAYASSKYRMNDYPEHWAAMKALAGELRTLSPALLVPDSKRKLAVSGAGDGIDVMIKEVDGAAYVFAVNGGEKALKASFDLTGCRAESGEVMFEKRELPVSGGAWSDAFEPLGVHVYKLKLD